MKKVFRKIKVPRGYKSLFNQCWKLKSEIVRRKAKGRCFTCPKTGRWQDFHAGHFRHGCLDFDNINIQSQCPYCNKYLSGNLSIYATNLVRKYGGKILTELDQKKWQTFAPTYEDLLILKGKFEKELSEIK